MSRKRNSLKYELKKRAFQNTKNEMNNHTKTTYRRSINRFAEWAVGRGCRNVNDITKKLIQEYEIYLEESPKSYAPSTIHTYLAPICVAVGVSMEEIKKPKRKARYISRSRHFDYSVKKEGNQQGLAEEKNPKYARVVAFDRVVGVTTSSSLLREVKVGRHRSSTYFHRTWGWCSMYSVAWDLQKKCFRIRS